MAGEAVADLGGVEVGELPAEAFAEVGGREVVGIVAVGDDGFVGVAFAGEVVVHADEDDLLKAHVEGELERDVGDGGAFPDAAADVAGEAGAGVGGVEEGWERLVDW